MLIISCLRFFLVKDGFLLYYSEGEKKTFDKKKYFNIHPKGVIPLGGCHIQTYSDMFHEYIIQIHNDNFINVSFHFIDFGFWYLKLTQTDRGQLICDEPLSQSDQSLDSD